MGEETKPVEIQETHTLATDEEGAAAETDAEGETAGEGEAPAEEAADAGDGE